MIGTALEKIDLFRFTGKRSTSLVAVGTTAIVRSVSALSSLPGLSYQMTVSVNPSNGSFDAYNANAGFCAGRLDRLGFALKCAVKVNSRRSRRGSEAPAGFTVSVSYTSRSISSRRGGATEI